MEYKIEFSHSTVDLNEEQYKVVTSLVNENQRILASAGSGKTTTITSRIAYLVEQYRINPSRILLVSFSRAAATEMIRRVHHLIGPVNLYAGTFHGLSAQILQNMAPEMLNDNPFIDELPHRLYKWLETDRGKKWVKRFRCIIVDEFQDINDIQWKLLMQFYHERTTMTIVGDDAQNIYTWRGSSVDFILNFHNYINNVRDYQLCINYRSKETIVTIANAIMRYIPTLPFKEKMIAHMKGGRKPEVHYFYRAADEYDWVVNSLDKLRKQFPHFTFAVLSRYNSDLYKVEERFHLKNIPYELITHPNPYSEKMHGAKISLTTIHASKGLEWDVIFFMNLHDDIFPARKGVSDIISERRLFYVGITRAKQGLYMTYSRQEKVLSRFVREIPRPFLKFHNVASFKLSTADNGLTIMSVEDMICGLDGADWNTLREQDNVPLLIEAKTIPLFLFGQLFTVPQWVRAFDVYNTWLEMIKCIMMRELAIHQNTCEQLCTPQITEALLTLRIYKEDLPFWQLYESEIEHLIHTHLKHTHNMPPIEYYELETYVRTKMKHIEWSVHDIAHAVIILSKIRGQLRPLRFNGFDIHEFTVGWTRNSVPTEMRADVLASWHRFINPTYKTHDILGDVWKIACIPSIIEGRNIPLYKYKDILPHLLETEQKTLTIALEQSIMSSPLIQEPSTLHFIFEVEGIHPISFDILTDMCAYTIIFDANRIPTNEEKILLMLKQYAYNRLFDRPLKSFGFINLATGFITEYKMTSTIREQLNHLWQHLQMKYHLFST
jgi:hypothetical protein